MRCASAMGCVARFRERRTQGRSLLRDQHVREKGGEQMVQRTLQVVQLRATTKGYLKPKAVVLSEQKVSISHFRSGD